MADKPKIKFQNKYLERALIDTNFKVLELSEKQLILKPQKKSTPLQNQLMYLAALFGAIYFLFFDYQPIIFTLLAIFLGIVVASKIIYPSRIKNEFFRFNHGEGFIEFRSGLSKETKRIDLLSDVNFTLQIDRYGEGTGHRSYSFTLFYSEENLEDQRIVLQFDDRTERQVLKFAKALQRYMVNLSEIEEIPITKKYK